jgi:hypothetical protein
MSPDTPSGDPGASEAGAIGQRPAWQPRFFEPGDEEKVVGMLAAAFGTWPRGEIAVSPAEHLRWKLSSHPAAGPLCVVTEDEGRIVGWQGYWLQNVKLDDRELLSRQAVDFAVDPEYQRMGIKLAMREKAQVNNPRRNFALHFGPASGHPALMHMGRKSGSAARSLLAQRVEARVLQVGYFARGGDAPRAWAVRDVSEFDERIDVLWELASKPFRLIVARRAAYLNWRYADPRGGRYSIKIAEQGERVLGYVVSRMSHGRGFLTDLFTLPGRIDVVRSLVADSVADLRSRNAAEVECWLPEHHPYWEALNHYPFDHKRRSVDFRVAPSKEFESAVSVPFKDDPKAPVHITIGDCDLGYGITLRAPPAAGR